MSLFGMFHIKGQKIVLGCLAGKVNAYFNHDSLIIAQFSFVWLLLSEYLLYLPKY